MSTITLPLRFKNHVHQDVVVDESIFNQYLEEFIKSYTDKKDDFFRIGDMSGEIISEGRMFGNIAEHAEQNRFAKSLEKSALNLNESLPDNGFGYSTWLSIDDYILESYDALIEETIKNKYNLSKFEKRTFLRTKTYNINGSEMVYYVYYEAGGGIELYVVPVDIAINLKLEDYNGKEISRWEPFMDHIEEFKLDFIESYNYD